MNDKAKKDLLQKIISTITNREMFCITYFSASMLWVLPLLTGIMDPFCKICFIWGSCLILWEFFKNRKSYYTYKGVIPVLFIMFYCITVVVSSVRMDASLYTGVKHIIYSSISFFLLLHQDQDTSEEILNFLKKFNNCIIVITLFASGISLPFYIFQAKIVVYMGENRWLRQGYLENRLFGVYSSPNVAAVHALLSIAAVLINLLIAKKSIKECSLFYKASLVIQLICFSLTLSNGGFLTLVTFAIVYMIVFEFPKMKEHHGNLKCILKLVGVTIVVLFAIQTIILGIRGASTIFPKTINEVKSTFHGEELEEIEFERIEEDSSNGRFEIWKGGIKTWLKQPVLGVSDPRGLIRKDLGEMKSFYEYFNEDNVKEKYDTLLNINMDNYTEEEIQWYGIAQNNMHNSYIQILVSSGIVGFALFLLLGAFALKEFIESSKFDRQLWSEHGIVGFIFCILAALLVNGLVEATILFKQQDTRGIIFWVYLGCSLALISKEKDKRKSMVMSEESYECDN